MGKTVAGMLRAIEAVSLVNEGRDVIESNPQELVDYNRRQLFGLGELTTGQKLKRYKNSAYARRKNTLNPLPGLGNPDFYLTGAFQREMYVDVQGNQIIFDSTNEKTNILLKRDGPAIFGLSQDSKVKYGQELRNGIVKRIRVKTGMR